MNLESVYERPESMQRQSCIACKFFVILPLLLLSTSLFLGLGANFAIASEKASEKASEEKASEDQVSEDQEAPRADCRSLPYRQFDFWLGQWSVHLADGQVAGSNSIRASEDGCLITERWQGARGSNGYSMNFYQPGSGLWRQVWVSRDSVIEIGGGLEDGSMSLGGEIVYPASGERLPFRGLWTPLEDGRVRQFFEEQRGNKWQPWFEGFYTKDVE